MASKNHAPELSGLHSAAADVYIAFIVTYTLSLLGDLALLWHHRGSSAIRIRGFLTTTFTVLCLHIYVAAIFIVYPVGSGYNCATEFWYMSVLFPLGLAMFQGANARLLAVSKLQHEAFFNSKWTEKKQPFSWTFGGFNKWYKQRDFAQKTYCWIVGLMICQITVALFVFFGSRRFSPKVGFFSEHVDQATCRRGFEWLPSILWQFVWTWIIGPYHLFKTRKIRDSHHWGLQTRLAVFSSLPGTPLWLAFLYTENTSHLEKLNYYWPPATWFAPGLIVMQVSSILIPLYDARKHPSPKRVKSIASSYTSSTLSAVSNASTKFSRRSKDLAGNFDAFQHQMIHNAAPLARFAAEREFTGENVEFLCRVNAFKRRWTGNAVSDAKREHDMYIDAARVYFELVDPSISCTPINIDSKTLWALQTLFDGLAYETAAVTQDTVPESVVTPWDVPPPLSSGSGHSSGPSLDPLKDSDNRSTVSWHDASSQKHLITTNNTSLDTVNPFIDSRDASTEALPKVASNRVTSVDLDASHEQSSSVTVPTFFDVHCFDQAEHSIKWLVYTNTWKSFLRTLDEEHTSASLANAISNLNPFRKFRDGAFSNRVSLNRDGSKRINTNIKANIEMLMLGASRKKSDNGTTGASKRSATSSCGRPGESE